MARRGPSGRELADGDSGRRGPGAGGRHRGVREVFASLAESLTLRGRNV